MDVIIMPSIHWLIQRVQSDYPDIIFAAGDEFHWSAPTKTIQYNPALPSASEQLLHELSHAILRHTHYTKDIDLIGMERDAWEHARHVAPTYDFAISDDTIQDALDSYRDWLHARSTCPGCQATGIQTKQQAYRCLACHQQWNVNEARLCALRRYTSPTKKPE